MSSWSTTKYKSRNWPAYNTALKQRGAVSTGCYSEMPWQARPTGKRGRQPEFSDATIQVCLTLKVLFGLPLRRLSVSWKACCVWQGSTGKCRTSVPFAVAKRRSKSPSHTVVELARCIC